MILDQIEKWANKFRKYLFYYKDGFFVLPYLNNSPELLLGSFFSMPFVNHNASERVAISKNPFVNAELRYEEIETGLWIIVTDVQFKANVQTTSIYDTGYSDYFFLVFALYRNEIIPTLDMKINQEPIPNNSWALYRPGIQIDGFHNKGTKGIVFDFAFNKKWLEANLLGRNSPYEDLIREILTSESGYLIWKNILPEAEILINNIWSCLSKNTDRYLSKLQLRAYTLDVLTVFFSRVNQQNAINRLTTQSLHDKEALKVIEKYLIENLQGTFPGIEFLSNLANMSSSKLKSSFKAVYGKSIFQYFQEKQMDLARLMLDNTDFQVKYIATTLGYENASKFSKAFKKHHKLLPSQIKDK